jgi:WD40 repeat protein
LALLLTSLLLTLATPPARGAAAEADAPILRIETGMHGAVINRLALAGDGSTLVTVSDDKTTRLWSLPDGAPRGVWRSPIGAGDAGALFAVAAHGETVVVGGRTAAAPGKPAALYVFDRASGKMRGSIGGFAEAIAALAFSRDGRYLAVGEQGHGGLAVLDLAGHKLAAQDRDYGGTVAWIAFAGDGRLATTSLDGEIRLYGADLKRVATARLPGKEAERPWGLAFSPDGKRLAVGSLEGGEVRLLAADTLRPERRLGGAAGSSGALSVVAWSHDGRLAAAGSYKNAEGARLLRVWRPEGGGMAPEKDVGVAADTVTDLAFLADDSLVYAGAEPSFGIVGPDGRIAFQRGADHADFRDSWQKGLRVSRDGAVVEFPGRRHGGHRFRFDLLQASLAVDPPPSEALHLPIVEDARFKPAAWRNGAAPTLNGRKVALDPGERVRSVAILPGGAGIAFGTDFYLRLEGAGGEMWRRIVPAPAWGVNASGDGRYVVAALGDGTIRWYAADDGREVMSLFVAPQDRRWVVWVPEGFFDHSHEPGKPGGETLVGYQLNNGPSKAADFVEIGQLYNLFDRRDLVLAKFRGGAGAERTLTDQLARIGDVHAVLKGGLPPRLELIEACVRPAGANDCPPGSAVTPASLDSQQLTVPSGGGTLFARYRIEDRGGGLGRVIVRRNGAVIDGTRTVESADAHQRTETVLLPLDADGDEIRFATETGSAAIQSRGADDLVLRTKAAPRPAASEAAAAEAPAELYLVSIGVSAYSRPEFRLGNAANDARSIAALFGKPSPPVYSLAHVTTLIDGEATSDRIAQAIGEVGAKARPQDIVVIFLSGHGEAVDGKYYFAPVDFATHHPELLAEAKTADGSRQGALLDELYRKEGFGEARLLPLLEKIQGNLLLVLDTCYSATLATTDAVERRARNETVARGVGHEIGRFILAGARSLALDSNGGGAGPGGEHGLFTTYLLKGLEGGADLQHNGRINVAELLMFTKDKVYEESRKLHLDKEPFYYFSGSNFFTVRAVASK